MSSKSILSFFKKPVNTANNGADDVVSIPNNSCTVVNSENVSSALCSCSLPEKPYRPSKDFVFPKTKFGPRYRSCQHSWFDNYPWLHYDIEKDCVFCFYCMKNISKLTAEKNKEPAYTSVGFKNWKKAPDCFKDHQNNKCHKGAATLQVIVPSCGDPLAMMNQQLEKSRAEERKYLRVVMECIQYLARQGLPIRGSDHIKDNLTQLLILRGKDNPAVLGRISSSSTSNKRKYTHQDYQNELIILMTNEVLRSKLSFIKLSNFFSIICDEYTDMSNKEQLSFCIRWIDENLCPVEDFLGYYELPNIKSDTIVGTIKDSLVRFQLPMQDLRGQTYDGASNMMGKKSGVAQQILREQPKALKTHCHGHSLSLSIKDANKQCRILSETMGTAGEIIVLIKFSPKRERMLGAINENIEVSSDGDDDVYEKVTALPKLSVTRWTVRANAFNKILQNYKQLMEVWDGCLEKNLQTEVRSRIIGCRAQMMTFKFFYGIKLSFTIYSITDKLSKALESEAISAEESQETAKLTLETMKSMRSQENSDAVFNILISKAEKSISLKNHHFPGKSEHRTTGHWINT